MGDSSSTKGSSDTFSGEERDEVHVEEFVGEYVHKAFGQMIVEMAEESESKRVETGNDVKVSNASSAAASSSSSLSPPSSEALMLSYGRFGRMELRRDEATVGRGGGVEEREEGEVEVWEGRFVGPLWYITASDESDSPVHVRFLRNGQGHVDRMLYPVDGRYDEIEFTKVMTSGELAVSKASLSSAVCRGSRVGLVVTVTLALLFTLQVWELLSAAH
jgi:hypothetical protein